MTEPHAPDLVEARQLAEWNGLAKRVINRFLYDEDYDEEWDAEADAAQLARALLSVLDALGHEGKADAGMTASAAVIGSETQVKLAAIAMQAARVVDSIEGAQQSGGTALWIALWDLRSLLLDIDSPSFDLPRPGGVA